jgi:hypothetical protein
MFSFTEHPSSNTTVEFYNGLLGLTDYGACCLIDPYLNFINPVSKDLSPFNITGDHWHSVPRGVQNGPMGGIKFVLDAETFAFAPMGQESSGFRIGIADSRDKPMIKQESFMISPGTNFINFLHAAG